MRKFTAWSLNLIAVLIYLLIFMSVFYNILPKPVLAGFLTIYNIATIPTNLFTNALSTFYSRLGSWAWWTK